MTILLLTILSFVFSTTGVAFFRRWAVQHILDMPNERSLHSVPTPRGGGILIVVVVLIGLLLSSLLFPSINNKSLTIYWIGGILIAAISWLDDVHTLPSHIRFGAHAIGALLILIGCGYWNEVNIPILNNVSLGILGIPITFLWIVGLTNAYNFMDGIDGLAGGQAVVAGVGWTVIGWISEQQILVFSGLLLSASSLGFLQYNWPPARIFMGDVGSAFLGYTFAALALFHLEPSIPLVGILLVWPFLFDTIFTFLRRLSRGENVFVAHRTHLYQRLVIAGQSHRNVTILYIGLSLVGTILSIAWYLKLPGSEVAIVLAIPVLCIFLCLLVRRKEQQRFFPLT